MTSKKLIILICLILLVFGILVVFVFDVNCIFKSIVGIPCPGCGLTRGFRELFSFHFLKAESYNILTIPLFLFLTLLLVLMVVDIIINNNYTEKIIKKVFSHYILIILVLFISWIINIIRGV